MTQKTVITSILIILTLVISNYSSAQIVQNKCDTVNIQAPAFLVLNDTTIHLNRDSTAIICNKYIVVTKKNGYAIYNKLVGESQKHGMVDKLFQLIISSSTQDTSLINKEMFNAEDVYTPYAGKVIRNIKIQVLKPFGASIGDTNLPVISTWGEALNKSHISTQKITIRRNLLIKQNDIVNPYELVENTNQIASLQYIEDASITITNVKGDSVDILVLAKDKFPWLPGIEIYDVNKMTAYLTHVNILGLGHSVKAGVTMDAKSSPLIYLSDLGYYNSNIWKQISGAINYSIGDYAQKYQLLFNRDLTPMSIRTGGGLELLQQEENIVIDPKDINQSAWYFKYRYYDIWVTQILNNKSKSKNYKKDPLFLIPGIGSSKREYLYRPYVSIDSNSRFTNFTQVLGNFALVKQNYYRTNFFRSFGKAEYIPYGFQATITGGYTWSEFMASPYLGVGFKLVHHVKDIGYFHGDLQIGSHFSDTLQQGAMDLRLSFMSQVFKKKRYRYRFLISLNHTSGINRITNDLLYLGEDYGFVGMKDQAYYGQSRTFSELYAVSYTPWYFLGFRFAMFAFYSGGFMGNDTRPIIRNQFISSFGLGVYTNNDFLAFNSLQVRVAYFPITPNGISHFGISFSTIGLFDNNNFLRTKPSVVEYK